MYRFPAKDFVRDHWIPFAMTRLSPDRRPSLRVWFFPGTQDAEFQAYRGAGFRSSQLLGFERRRSRAGLIKGRHPDFKIIDRPLLEFLNDPQHRFATCDWANLDFDGSAITFVDEVVGVIQRMRSDRCCLGLSSHAQSDPFAIEFARVCRCVWWVFATELIERTEKRMWAHHREMGLVLDDDVNWNMVLRELSIFMIFILGFGQRFSGPGSVSETSFIEDWDTVMNIAERGVITPEEHSKIDALRNRTMPVKIADLLRFVYSSRTGSRRWTWYLRVEPAEPPITLGTWMRTLLLAQSSLHVLDEYGGVIGDRSSRLCAYCYQLNHRRNDEYQRGQNDSHVSRSLDTPSR